MGTISNHVHSYPCVNRFFCWRNPDIHPLSSEWLAWENRKRERRHDVPQSELTSFWYLSFCFANM